MIQIPERVIEELKNYREKVNEYEKGAIDPVRFKPYRVAMGIYEQREKDTYMVRTRIPSGVVTLQQLKKISELADRYGHRKVHFTTRQDIQFHKITLQNTADIIEGLLGVGIITRGTGGNTARNIVASPLSGVAPDEIFDVLEYAENTTSYLLKDPTVFNLPRKFKIGFSNTPADTANATLSDLGFIAKIKNGQKGFEVYGGGGLGSNPAASVKLEDFIPAREVLYHVQAMKELFENEGDRTNKHKARIRYILQRLGEEEFKNRYQILLEKVKAKKNLDIEISEESNSIEVGQKAEGVSNLLVEQKNRGFYSVYIHTENGNMTTEHLNKIIHFLEGLEYKASIRITNTQGFFVRDLKGNDADSLLTIISGFTSPFDIDNSIACAGAATCQLGLCLSQNLLSAIRERFKNVEAEIKSALPRIFISGCPNSCGQYQKGEVGLAGKAKRTEDGLVPMYTIYFGGNVGAGGARLAKPYGDIPARKIPEFLYELALLKSKCAYKDFTAFFEKEATGIDQLIKQFSEIETESQNPDLYYDFGSEEKFSLKGRGPGECSAGVLDVIQLDISNAQTYLAEFNQTKESSKLYHSALSAARALLVLKGIDTNKEREIFKEFIKNFIEAGYVKISIKELIDHLIDYRLGDLESLEEYYSQVEYLVLRVKTMYESLSSQLEITLEKEGNTNEENKAVENSAKTDLEIVDLRGVKCPINFVKAKVALAKVASGQVIGFYLDDGEPIQNVPKSLEGEGHEIIHFDSRYDGYHLLTVKKK